MLLAFLVCLVGWLISGLTFTIEVLWIKNKSEGSEVGKQEKTEEMEINENEEINQQEIPVTHVTIEDENTRVIEQEIELQKSRNEGSEAGSKRKQRKWRLMKMRKLINKRYQ